MTPPTLDRAVVAERIAAARERVATLAAGRAVELVAVTKGFGPDAIAAAAAAGCGVIGENYAQELLSKRATIADTGVEVQFIGRLQTNKVRLLADVVTVWASIDRARLVAELAKRAAGARILAQVDATGEPGKGGCPPDAVADLVAMARAAGLVVDGLMTVGPTDADPARTRAAFATTRRLVDQLGLAVCSMGMSGDLAIAIEEGATQIRLGTALFGTRRREGPT
ncbi:MAG: YggS family pyridoxal phosphate-dependent enzyme [Desertimonas sp.]